VNHAGVTFVELEGFMGQKPTPFFRPEAASTKPFSSIGFVTLSISIIAFIPPDQHPTVASDFKIISRRG
jgi:hypothetical protein